jgi:hypothetical protein
VKIYLSVTGSEKREIEDFRVLDTGLPGQQSVRLAVHGFLISFTD